MGWNGVEDRNERMLRRMIALLLALAGLAESASLRSPAIRAAVLWLLRPGEDVATAYLAALTGRVAAPPAGRGPVGDGAADAMHLASVFRALAAALAALLDDLGAPWPSGTRRMARRLLTARRARPVGPRWNIARPAVSRRCDSS